METLLVMLALATLFVASHVGLALAPVRSRLTARLGTWGFVWLYVAVAATTFSAAVVYYADHRFTGPAGPALARVPLVREALVATIVTGVVLMTAAFAGYARSPYAVGTEHARFEPRGLERVTRHAFFAGTALLATAHALLATHLIGSVFMLGLALLSVGGAMHQDRKLVRLHGERMRRYLAATSAVPFVAIAAGRQRLVLAELPARALGAGLVLALVLSRVHDRIFDGHGIWVVAAVAGGGVATTFTAWLAARQPAPSPRRSSDAPAP
jgi:uncharacterized membrane protein